jgi:hypothetical protein
MGLYAGEIGALDRHCAQPPQGLGSFRAEGSAGVDFTQRDLLGMSRHCDYGSEGAGGEREHEDDEKGELMHVVFLKISGSEGRLLWPERKYVSTPIGRT